MLEKTEDEETNKSKVSELKGLENSVRELKTVCIEVTGLSHDLDGLVTSGDTTRPESPESKERERGKDRITEIQLKVLNCIDILSEGKRLFKLLKEKFE